jgi:hypothetical protein
MCRTADSSLKNVDNYKQKYSNPMSQTTVIYGHSGSYMDSFELVPWTDNEGRKKVRKLRCTGKKTKRTEDKESNGMKKTCNGKDVKGDT